MAVVKYGHDFLLILLFRRTRKLKWKNTDAAAVLWIPVRCHFYMAPCSVHWRKLGPRIRGWCRKRLLGFNNVKNSFLHLHGHSGIGSGIVNRVIALAMLCTLGTAFRRQLRIVRLKCVVLFNFVVFGLPLSTYFKLSFFSLGALFFSFHLRHVKHEMVHHQQARLLLCS